VIVGQAAADAHAIQGACLRRRGSSLGVGAGVGRRRASVPGGWGPTTARDGRCGERRSKEDPQYWHVVPSCCALARFCCSQLESPAHLQSHAAAQ
jgi:hypothetical protein